MDQVLGVSQVRGKSGPVDVSSLASKDYVLLYFSASWCPPCKAFTPVLADFYNANKDSKNFEIIFVSLDQDEKSFLAYYEHHPWLGLFSEEGKALAAAHSVQSIPTLIVLDKNGQVVTKDARNKVPKDPTAASFPWA